MSPTIHLQLLPTLSPATNALEPEQRPHHRCRSTRKLKAIRGTIPLFLDLDSKVDIMPKAPTLVSPRTRAIRRKGQVFQSHSSDSTEPDYVFVNINTRSGFNYHQAHSPSSSPSRSPDVKPATQGSNPRSGKSAETHAGGGIKLKSKGPQSLAQPFLLRLRSLPVPPAPTIKPETLIDQSKPLSPVSSSFNMDMSTASSRPRNALTDNEKRRKLAKLARTLGENVPPELVFHSAPPHQRATSTSVSRPQKKPPSSHKPSLSLSTPSSVAKNPAPQPQSARRPENPEKRQSRPRSMSLTTSGTMAKHSDTRGTKSLDQAYHTVDPPLETITAVNTVNAVNAETTRQHDALSSEWGRRKEREWSGEWNVKDMQHVTNVLRGLKAR